MVHVADLAKTLVDAHEHAAIGNVHHHVLECGPYAHATVLQIAETIRDIAARITNSDPVPIVHLPMRPGEIPGDTVVADPNTLILAGLTPPEIELDTGMEETVHWFHLENTAGDVSDGYK
jgi:UDP-glucose 4-epimerase